MLMESHLQFELVEARKIHLGICGSIAAYKAVDLMRAWQRAGAEVSVTLTPSATKFISPLTFESLGANPVYKGMFDEPLSHLMPSKDAHAIIIAPASADTIAQIASGRADTLLASQVLAFDKKVVIAPAMNPKMWKNPATQENIRILQERGMVIIPPESGKVACKDEGQGRLSREENIFLHGLKSIIRQDLKGKTVLVTTGATREYFDTIRCWTNKSTGTMGMCFAIAAWLRGATVHAICTENVTHFCPSDTLFHKHTVRNALEMFNTVEKYRDETDYGIFTAAVSDFRPEEYNGEKFKKSEAPDGFSLNFYPNEDILKHFATDKKSHQKVLGFAAEWAETSEILLELTKKKLTDKNADMIVGNAIIDGFGTDSNKVVVVDNRSNEEVWQTLPKTEVAWNVLTRLISL